MSEGSAERAAPVTSHAHKAHSSGLLECIPPELVPQILEYLDQSDLRSAAGVSRLFYDSAWRAGLYLHLNLKWHSFHCDLNGLETLNEIVNHVRRKGLRFSVWATFQTYGVGTRLSEAINSRIAQDILDLLSSALPVLVHLSILTPGDFFPAVAAVLRHPAPNLAMLDLCIDQVHDGSDVHRVPMDLFMESAPKLCHLELKDITLGQDPVPAFARVDTLTLDYSEVYPDIAYALHFPRLRCLHLNFYTDEETSPPWSFRLDGVRLRKLTLGECYPSSLIPSIMRSTRLEEIADVVLNVHRDADWSDPIWTRQEDGPFSIRMMDSLSKEKLGIVVAPEHRRWRRAYNMDIWSIYDSFPLLGLPGFAARLAYLRLENVHIPALLECRGLALGALRALRVDMHAAAGPYAAMVWPPDWLVHGTFSFGPQDASAPVFGAPSYACVDCSALRRLTLFAMDTVLGVESPEVAFLGRALSQPARAKQDRASLVLFGVELTEYSHPLLDQTFSAVSRHDFVGWDSFSGQDAGLWQPEFH